MARINISPNDVLKKDTPNKKYYKLNKNLNGYIENLRCKTTIFSYILMKNLLYIFLISSWKSAGDIVLEAGFWPRLCTMSLGSLIPWAWERAQWPKMEPWCLPIKQYNAPSLPTTIHLLMFEAKGSLDKTALSALHLRSSVEAVSE